MNGLRSKSWEEFAQPGAPLLDLIFTVCDKAANEVCSVWPGRPMTAHWDPAAFRGADEEARQGLYKVALQLKRRIELLPALPLDKIETLALRERLRAIGNS